MDATLTTAGDGTTPSAPDFTDERIRLLFRQAPPAQLMGLVVAAILVVVLWRDTEKIWLLAWAAVFVSVTLLRLAVVAIFFRSGRENPERWETIYIAAAALSGLAWGGAGLLPAVTPSLLHQSFIILVLAGTSAGAIASNAPSYRAYLAFAIPTLTPIAAWELYRGDSIALSIAALISIFLLLMIITTLNFHRALLESLRIRGENRLLSNEITLAASVFDNSLQGILITDIEGNIVKINPAATELTGYSSDEAVGRPIRSWYSIEHDVPSRDAVMMSLSTTGRWEGEVWYRRQGGEVFPVWQTVTTTNNERGEPVRRIVIFGDISERKRAEDNIRRIAFQDALTELPNRRVFEDRLANAVERAKRHGGRFAVLFVDLDKFRSVNDSLGYPIGDQLLRATAQRLQERVRLEDTVARLESDKFGLILEAIVTAGDAETVAQNVINSLKAPLKFGLGEINPGSSIGIAICPEDGLDVHTLLENADTALNQATKEGGNALCFYSSRMSLEASERLAMEWGLRRAIEHNELVLYYQPQFSLSRNEVIGMEALVRWQHPDRGLLAPNHFIPLAEETKLIIPLSRWVVRRAMRDWPELTQQSRRPLRLNINVSAQDFPQPNFVSSIATALRESGMPPAQLELEITEAVLIHDMQLATATLQRLKDLGVRVAIDDFGTGYSSLSYVAKLPIDTIKIDRAFIRNLDKDTSNIALVTAILQLCQSLKLEVVAEGVETPAEAAALRQLGGDMFQGYLFSRPVPKELFVEKIASAPANLLDN